MSFHDDLLRQAVELSAPSGRGRPQQAYLRRAVSTAYYALFHLLISESSKMVVGVGISVRDLRSLVARAFDHREMKDFSKSIYSGGLQDQVLSAFGGAKPSPELKFVARIFVNLQEARHKADYDLSEHLTKNEVEDHLQGARDAFQAWNRIRNDPEAKVYLTGLLLNRKWKR